MLELWGVVGKNSGQSEKNTGFSGVGSENLVAVQLIDQLD